MSRFFCITGPGRCGTLWLTHVLNTCPDVSAHHDLFAAPRLMRDLDNIERITAGHVGTVSGHARESVPFIHERLQPAWVFLWRDPVSLVRSHADIALHIAHTDPNRNQPMLTWPHERLLHYTAHCLFGDLELSLRQFERLQIPVRHFLMRRYITREGFGELCEHLGIEYDGHDLTGPRHALPRRVPPPSEWTRELTEFALQSFYALPLLSGIHAEICDQFASAHGRRGDRS